MRMSDRNVEKELNEMVCCKSNRCEDHLDVSNGSQLTESGHPNEQNVTGGKRT